MRIIILVFLLITLKVNAQETGIDSVKLAGLCKIWGLVKNYNNSVLNKNVDWDHTLITKYSGFTKSNDFDYYNTQILELLSTLPKKQLKNGSEKEYNSIINNNIQDIGTFSFLEDTNTYKNRISFSWIDDEIFSDSVKNILCNILINYKPKKNKYLKGSTVVHHKENDFLELDSISEPYRMLGLFRYWNIINYYFPYKHLMNKNWGTVLVAYINKIKNAPNYITYKNEFVKFASNINDSHGYYNLSNYKYFNYTTQKPVFNQAKKKKGYIPYNFEILDNKVIVKSILTDSTNIRLGDTVLSINNLNLSNYISNYPKFKSSSTHQSSISNIEISLSRFYNSAFRLKIKKNNDTLNYIENGTVDSDTKTESFYIKPPFYKTINDSVGYIELTQIKLKEFNKAWKEFKNNKTIIFDLRGYPETPVWLILPHLLSKTKLNVAEFYYPSNKYAGIFIKNKKTISYKFWFVKPFVGFKKKYNGNIIVLINADAISQAETVCMMFKAYSDKATFIGEPTSGANGDVVKIDIPGGIYFYFSSLDWHFSNGQQLQRIGIIPDIKVRRDVKTVINNKDRILMKAIEYANKQQ